VELYSVDKLIAEARRLAAAYREATGQPLAVSGEIARYDAARLLDLDVPQRPQGGWDAVGRHGARAGVHYQIKARAIFDESKAGQRMGQLKLDQPWDAVLLVLMDAQFMPYEIHEADRDTVTAALDDAGDSRRNKRGAMTIARFKNIARLVWTREDGIIDDEIWDNRTS
jgi:hypothetical protein